MGITRYGTRSCPKIYSVSCNRTYVTKYFSKYVYNFSRMSIIRRNNRQKIYKHTTPAKEAVNRITDASAEDPRCVPPSLLPLRAHYLIRSSSLSYCFRVFSLFSSYCFLKPSSSWCFQQCTTSAPNRDAATRAWSTLWDRARLPAAVSTPPHWMTHPPITNLEKDYVTLVLLTPTIRQYRSAGFFRMYLFSNRGCKNSQGVVNYMKVFLHLKLTENFYLR